MSDLIALIKQSQSLSEIEKQALLATARYLPQTQVDQLIRIFTTEKEGVESVEKKFVATFTETNKKHIQEIDDLMRHEKRQAVNSEEQEELQKSNQILNQLNNA